MNDSSSSSSSDNELKEVISRKREPYFFGPAVNIGSDFLEIMSPEIIFERDFEKDCCFVGKLWLKSNI